MSTVGRAKAAQRAVDVAIVGLGPTGAVLANILGAAGVSVVVFDREPEPLRLPRAVHLDGEVMRVFQSIGLADEVAKVIRLSRGVRYYSATGRLLMERRPPAAEGRHLWADKNMFHQPDLERVLRRGIERYADCVDVRLQHEVLSVREQGDAVELEVRDLTGAPEASSWRASWVVGSDGGRSLVRRTMNTELEDFGVHDPWLVVDIELLRELDLPDCTVQYCDPERPTTYVHVTGNRRRWEFKILPTDDIATIAEPENVWRLLSRWVTPEDAVLVRDSVYVFHALIAKNWRQGRLFLAGDSAHQTPPFLGQGMCTGIRDAANLGWKLARVAGRGDSRLDAELLLDSYESERRPHCQVFIETAARLGGIIQTTDPAAAAARDAEMLAGEDAIEFRDPAPPLGPGLHLDGGLGGTIVAQPRLSTGERLDDAVGARFALVASGSGWDDGIDALRVRAADDGVLWIEDPALDEWLEDLGARAVLLRPDRYAVGGANTAAELGVLLDLVEQGDERGKTRMTQLRIVNVRTGGGDTVGPGDRVGVVVGEDVVDVAELTGVAAYASIGNFMRSWGVALQRVREALESSDAVRDASRTPLATARLLAPVRHGAAVFGAGANYYGHAREMAELAGRPAPEDPRTAGQSPWHFIKAPSTVVGDGATVAPPAAAPDTLDWEVELAVVIGARGKDIPVEDALAHVAGYTVANDLSARGLLWRDGLHASSPFRADWVLHKNFDGSTPLGPWLVPADELADPQDLALGLRVNGATMQSDRTSDMIFTIAEQIAHLSRHLTLTPGDVILTGTPGGNAAAHGRFLAPGDMVEAWVDGIGTLTTHIGGAAAPVAPAAAPAAAAGTEQQ